MNAATLCKLRRLPDLEAPHGPAKAAAANAEAEGVKPGEIARLIIELEEEMFTAAEELRFEYAAKLRDEIKDRRRELLAFAEARVSRARARSSTRHSSA